VTLTAYFDGEDCLAKAGKKFWNNGCPLRWMGDVICDLHWLIPECKFDKGDCKDEWQIKYTRHNDYNNFKFLNNLVNLLFIKSH
jgi:hypothetical protein